MNRKLILKSHRFVPFCAKFSLIGAQIWHPCLSTDVKQDTKMSVFSSWIVLFFIKAKFSIDVLVDQSYMYMVVVVMLPQLLVLDEQIVQLSRTGVKCIIT